ncbi:MAG: hypothetical protein AABW85_03145 [archaeon]
MALLAIFSAVFFAGTVFGQQSTVCVENWVCSGWSTCSGGVQGRLCGDESQCGTFAEKPIETRKCVESPVCGDGVCAASETPQNCGSDCPLAAQPGILGGFSIDSFWSTSIALLIFIGLIFVIIAFLKQRNGY